MNPPHQPGHGPRGQYPHQHSGPPNWAGQGHGPPPNPPRAGVGAGIKPWMAVVGVVGGLALIGAVFGNDGARDRPPKPESRSAAEAPDTPEPGDAIPVQTEDGRTMTMAEYQKQGERLTPAECVAGIEGARAFMPYKVQAEDDPATGKPKTSQAFCATAKLDRWSGETNTQWRCEGAASDLAAYLRCNAARRKEVLEYVRKYDAARYQAAKDMHRQLYVADLVEREAKDSETLSALNGALTEAGARADAMAGIDHCVSGVLSGDKAVVGGLAEFIKKKDFKKLIKERKVENVTTVCSAFFYAMALNAARDGAE